MNASNAGVFNLCSLMKTMHVGYFSMQILLYFDQGNPGCIVHF